MTFPADRAPDPEPRRPELSRLAADAVDLVKLWLSETGAQPEAGARRLAELLGEPGGLEFAVQFIDGVARPRDLRVAAANLNGLGRRIPSSLPWYFRAALWLGSVLGPLLPWLVVPAARYVLRRLVGHLVVDHTPERLGPSLAKLREQGASLNLNLLGEAVLGEEEAARRLAGVRELLERPDVDYVSIKVSSIVSNLNMWAFDDAVAKVVQRLTPLYELAAAGTSADTSVTPGRSKFINLDMEEYRDLNLTIAVFKRLLSNPRLRGLEAGIVLQAYLPDALDALQDLTEWAQSRRAAGGAAIKVRIVKGANLAMEKVDATLHGWPLATWGSKLETDVNYKRLLDWALTDEHTRAVHIGVAGHNLFDLAFAWLLASDRGVTDRMDVEMLLGMATGQADAVARTAGRLTLYTPVVRPDEFDVAISYLVRRLEENGSTANFMSAMFSLADSPELFERERDRFLDAVRALGHQQGPVGLAPLPNRRQDRNREWQDDTATAIFHPRVNPIDPAAEAAGAQGLTSAVLGLDRAPQWGHREEESERPLPRFESPWVFGGDRTRFRNQSDTDPALAANRAWGKRITSRIAGSDLGIAAVLAARVSEPGLLDRIIAATRAAGVRWGGHSGSERASVLETAGLALAANRDQLIEVMAAETGKTIAEGDVEVSEAADFAHYYAALARELDTVQGAVYVPSALTVVTPPWNFPVSIPAGGVLSALAAGSAVIIKPAPQAKRSAAVLVDVLHRAGVPRDAVVLVDVEEGPLGQQLIADQRVDRVILTGSYETAQLFRSWRPDLPLLAETSGKNAIIVTPSADVDLAVADVVRSAFGNAGQKCSAASLVILVGSAGDDERFIRQLVDATRSLTVDHPTNPAAQVGPLIEPAAGKLLAALTALDEGEEWLVQPRRLDDAGRLWSPGVKSGVAAGSRSHLTEFFGPVLGIMRAKTLAEAVQLQNAVEYGLTAGLHALDPAEIGFWLGAVEAGNLYVNRHITGAIVQRQPFGGWKRSSVGTTVKAGGPNTLLPLGTWRTDTGEQSSSLHLRGLDRDVSELIQSGQPAMDYEEFDVVRRSALSDAIAFATEYGAVTDASGLGIERNVFRYRPVPVSVRLAPGGAVAELVRVIAAATLAKAPFDVSTDVALPAGLKSWLDAHSVPLRIESDDEWLGRLAFVSVGIESAEPYAVARAVRRIRLIGGNGLSVAHALRGDPDVAVYDAPVTASGRVELLPFFREQAISITAHRFGTPDHLTDELV